MDKIKKLKGWMTTEDAAARSGFTVMSIWLKIKMREIAGKDIRRVGKLYIVREKAVNALKRRGRKADSYYPKEKAE